MKTTITLQSYAPELVHFIADFSVWIQNNYFDEINLHAGQDSNFTRPFTLVDGFHMTRPQMYNAEITFFSDEALNWFRLHFNGKYETFVVQQTWEMKCHNVVVDD